MQNLTDIIAQISTHSNEDGKNNAGDLKFVKDVATKNNIEENQDMARFRTLVHINETIYNFSLDIELSRLTDSNSNFVIKILNQLKREFYKTGVANSVHPPTFYISDLDFLKNNGIKIAEFISKINNNLTLENFFIEREIRIAKLGFEKAFNFFETIFSQNHEFMSKFDSSLDISEFTIEEQQKIIFRVFEKYISIAKVSLTNGEKVRTLVMPRNKLWMLEPKKLDEMLSTIRNSGMSVNIDIWHISFDQIMKDSSTMAWDQEKRKKFLRTYLLVNSLSDITYGGDFSSVNLTNAEWFEVFKEYIGYRNSYGMSIRIVLSDSSIYLKLDDEQRLLIVEHIIELTGEPPYDLRSLVEDPKKRLEFCLKNAASNNTVLYNAHWFDLGNFDHPSNSFFDLIDSWGDSENTMLSFMEICNTLWPNNEFHKIIAEKSKNKKIFFDNPLDSFDLFCSLLFAMIHLTLKSEDEMAERDKILALMIKEILDFPTQQIRFGLIDSFMTTIWNAPDGRGFKILEELLYRQFDVNNKINNEKGKKTWAILLYIPLTCIILEKELDAKAIKEKELLKRVSLLLNELPKAYKEGHRLYTLISTVQTLSSLRDKLSPEVKLSILENIIGVQQNVVCEQIIDSKPSQAQLKILREQAQQQKKNKNKPGYVKEKIRKQIGELLLIQGLAGLLEVDALKESNKDNFEKILKRIVAQLFNLTNEQAEQYQEVFLKLRNASSVLTYLSKIKLSPSSSRSQVVNLYNRFIQTVLSPNQRDFYTYRYSDSNSPHLRQVFDARPILRSLWQQNSEEGLERYVEINKIQSKKNKIDYQKFLYNRIVEHGHMGDVACTELKAYLKTTDEKVKEEIKVRLDKLEPGHKMKDLKENQDKELATSEIEANFQKKLIAFVESKNNPEEQLSYLRDARKYYRKIHKNLEFGHDLAMLNKTLLAQPSKESKINLKDCKIVNTDQFWHLFRSGTDVAGSCVRVDGDPSLNHCLISYVMDGKNRLLAIVDTDGVILVRAILRILLDSKTKDPVLFLEEIYPYTVSSVLSQAIQQFALDVAKELNLPLTMSAVNTDNITAYPNPIESLGGPAPWEYVDANHNQALNSQFSIKFSTVFYSPDLERLNRVKELFLENRTGPVLNESLSKISTIVAEYSAQDKKDQEEISHKMFVEKFGALMKKLDNQFPEFRLLHNAKSYPNRIIAEYILFSPSITKENNLFENFAKSVTVSRNTSASAAIGVEVAIDRPVLVFSAQANAAGHRLIPDVGSEMVLIDNKAGHHTK